jgi:hypothetical protein
MSYKKNKFMNRMNIYNGYQIVIQQYKLYIFDHD